MTNGRGGSAHAFTGTDSSLPPDAATAEDPLSASKAMVRREARARRPQAREAAGPQADRAIAERLMSVVAMAGLASDATVGGYLAVKSEADPRAALVQFDRAGHPTALPVVTGPARPLIFRRWIPGDPLEQGTFGIGAPLATAQQVQPTLVLVPMLAFDRAGGRVGYGGGFYDRTLQRLRARGRILAVGIAYAGQEVASVPVGPLDQRLDWVVTDREAIRTGGE